MTLRELINRTLADLAQLRLRLSPKRKAAKPPQTKLTSPPPIAHPHRFGIDLAWGFISPAALKKAGVTFVVRYLSHDPSKNLTRDYAQKLAKAGIDNVVVWETTADRAKAGTTAGIEDAKEALKEARACGMPPGRPVYFAVDFEANGSEVTPYFRGAAKVLGPSATGVYGSYTVVAHLMTLKVVSWGWQTYAWSKGMWFSKAQLFQYSNSHTIAGVEIDYDHSAAVADFGQWKPA